MTTACHRVAFPARCAKRCTADPGSFRTRHEGPGLPDHRSRRLRRSIGRRVILRLDNLTRSFGSLKAVDGVELEVAPGEALGIIGPNGAGKIDAVQSHHRRC